MMSTRAVSATAAVSVVVGAVLLSASPVLAAANRPAAPTPASGVPATLFIRTIPEISGARIFLDSHLYRTDSHGFAAIRTSSGGHRIHILPPLSHPPRTAVHFSRWLDGIALADRRITLRPGTNREQAGFVVAHPIAVAFTDTGGRPLPATSITQLTVDSSLGERFTFSPARPPRWFDVNRIVRNPSGLVPLDIRYSVRDVMIDGSNVVYGGSQNFFVRLSRPWTVKVLLFPLRIEVKDALFRFGIGNAVRLTLPNGSSRVVRLGAGHAVTVSRLPRATYQLAAKGPGYGLAAPSTLSKPQVARVLLLSWVDVLAVVAFLAFFLVGLPVLGGRIVRHPGGARRPVWHVVRPMQVPAAKRGATAGDRTESTLVLDAIPDEPEAAASGHEAADEEQPASASGPETTDGEPAGGAGGPETTDGEPAGSASGPRQEALPESEASTEVFAAITDGPQNGEPGHDAGTLYHVNLSPGSGVAIEVRARTASTTSASPEPGSDVLSGSEPSATDKPASDSPRTSRLTRVGWPTWKWRRP